jgi:hypothetical protein
MLSGAQTSPWVKKYSLSARGLLVFLLLLFANNVALAIFWSAIIPHHDLQRPKNSAQL